MGLTYLRKIIFFSSVFIAFNTGFSQPFVDILNTSFQSLTTKYKDSTQIQNKTDNYYLNLTIPIRLDSQNTIIARFYGENLHTQATINNLPLSFNVSSALLPLGFQRETKNKKWKYLGLVMPKLSGHLREETTNKDFQLGGYGLVTYTKSNNFKIKLGLFYNREFFGNFFVPLFGIDWRVSDRFQMYGVLPTSYRLEYAILKQKLYAGFAFKSYTRSYHIDLHNGTDSSNVYVRNNELQAKAFVELYMAKKFVLFGEFGRTINYSPRLFWSGGKDKVAGFTLYSPIQDNFFFNVGIAYRIRFDFN
ncbi:MAG: DUF6268 family outer membrane beta-barrel protein [Bacteroidia bacterium]